MVPSVIEKEQETTNGMINQLDSRRSLWCLRRSIGARIYSFEKPGAKTGTSAVRGIIKSKKAMRIEMPSLIFVHKK